MEKINVNANNAGISEALVWINEKISGLELPQKDEMQKELMAEETLIALARHANENDFIEIEFGKRMNSVYLQISARGSEFNRGEIPTDLSLKDIEEQTDGIRAQAYIQNMMARAFADQIKYSNRNGINSVRLLVIKSKVSSGRLSLTAIGLAVVLGVLLRFFCPVEVNDVLCNSVFKMVQSVFMNLLFCTVGPIVFFSIVSAVSSFSDLSSFGRIGVRIFSTYIFTSIVAVSIGTTLVKIFKPGKFGSIIIENVAVSEQTGVSLKDTILGMIPSNIVKSFLDNNTLQIIVLAIIIGISINIMGEHAKIIHEISEALNALFLQVISILSKAIPLVLFCAIMSLALTTDMDSVISIMMIILLQLLGVILMIGVYCIMLLVNGINPITFLKKYLPFGISIGIMQSSNAGIPINMNACEKLGIPKRIYAFSIPLGATVNMDGNTVAMSIMLLTFARLCGINVSGSMLITLCVTILLISMATPGIPAASISFLAFYFSMLGLESGLLPLAIMIQTLMDMILTFSNVSGDAAMTLMVTKQEKQLDLEEFRK